MYVSIPGVRRGQLSEAADSLGLYLQVELPMWIKDVGRYPQRRDFFEKEMYAILDEYGNHPSIYPVLQR